MYLSRFRWVINLSSLVTLCTFVFYIRFARLDPDPHHDGIQITSALAVAEGLKVHSQVFNQYGPMTNWVQSIWLQIFTPNLFSLRIWSCLMVALSAGLLIRVSRQLKFPTSICFLASMVWVSSCPVWTFDSGFFGLWPWPSLLYLVFSLLSLSLIISWKAKTEQRSSLGFISGMVLALGAFTRLNYGVPLMMGFLVGVTILSPPSFSRFGKSSGPILAGASITSILILGYLVLTRSLDAFITQAVLGPLEGKSAVSTGWNYFYDNYFKQSISVILGLIFFALVFRYIKIWVLKVTTLVIFGFYLSTRISLITVSDLLHNNFAISKLWSHLDQMSLLRILLVSAAVTIVFSPFYFLTVLARLFIRRSSSVIGDFYFVNIAAVAALLQLYPLADAYHLWWTSPILILLLIEVLHRFNFSMPVVLLMFGIYSFFGLESSKYTLRIPRVEWTTGVLKGMMIPANYLDAYKSADVALSTVHHKSRYLCRDGLWAVWNGTYLSNSPNYVEWGTASENIQAVTEGRLVVCDWPGDGRTAEVLERRVISTGGPNAYDYSRFSGGYFIDVLSES